MAVISWGVFLPQGDSGAVKEDDSRTSVGEAIDE